MSDPWAVLFAAAGGTVLGALIGAMGAYIVARMSRAQAREERVEAREERFADDVRKLAGALLTQAEAHHREVRSEVAWRTSADNAPWPIDRKPEVGSTEPLYEMQAELHVMVRKPETGAAAYDLYEATVELDHFAAQRRDLFEDGHVAPLDEVQKGDFVQREIRYLHVVAAFIAAVRVELGREPFDPLDSEDNE